MMRHAVVFTDGEPDDIIALPLLASRFPDHYFDVVVGEGKELEAKAARVSLALGGGTIYLGETSEAAFSETTQSRVVTQPYTNELLQFAELVIVLKPPRELINVPHDMLRKKTLWMYGSFNFRCLLKTISGAEITAWLSAFDRVYLYESFFATGEKNVVTRAELGGVMDDLLTTVPGLALHMREWDAFHLQKCRETCEAINPAFPARVDDARSVKYNRTRKRYNQLLACGGEQFVLADVGLALTTMSHCDYNEGAISINAVDGYTVFKPMERTNQFVVKPIEYDVLLKRLSDWLASARGNPKYVISRDTFIQNK